MIENQVSTIFQSKDLINITFVIMDRKVTKGQNGYFFLPKNVALK